MLKNKDERFVWGCRYTVEYPSVDNRQGVTFDLKSHQYSVATTIYTRERCLANPLCGGPVAHFSPKARMHLDELLELIKVQGHAHGRVFERKLQQKLNWKALDRPDPHENHIGSIHGSLCNE